MKNELKNGPTSPFRNPRGKLDTFALAEQLMQEYHVINLRDRLYIYDNGIYVYDMQELENAIRRYGRGAKLAEVKTTLKDLLSMAPIKEVSGYEYVAFNNCIVNYKTLETFDFDFNKFIITSKVYANYDVNVLKTNTPAVQLVDKYVNDTSCGDVELQKCFFGVWGYCFLRTAKYQRAFILKGNANNGKSDFIHIIFKLLGEHCTALDLKQLSTLSNLMKLYHCTANVIDDVTEISRVDFARLNSIISGGNIAVKSTGDKEFSFAPYSTIVLATTHNLDFSSCNDETFRRFKVIPFNAKFSKDTVDRDMTEKLLEPSCLDVIATKAIQAVSQLGREWEFPTSVERYTDMLFFEGNPVLAFAKTNPIKRIISVDDYYRKYCVWFINTFGTECNITSAVFGRRLSELMNIKSKPHKINNITDTYYEASDFNFNKFRQEYQEYLQSLDNNTSPMSLLEYVKYRNRLDDAQETK